MDGTAKKLIALLDASSPELRMAAIRVVSEIGLNSTQVIHSIGRCLRDENEALRLLSLSALARLGAKEVVEQVVPLILEPGALRDHALRVVTAVGSSVIPHLTRLYGGADFHGKRALSSALAQIGGKTAFDFLLRVLPDEPFELKKHLTRSLCEALEAMAPAVQSSLHKPVVRFLTSARARKEPQLLVDLLVVLGYFHGEALARSTRRLLLKYTASNFAPEVRRHALVSFQRLIAEGQPGGDQVATLEKLLCDPDWHNVAQHALLVFQRIEFDRAKLLKLMSLLNRSPHFSVHIHIFERLRGQDRREVARSIIPFLSDGRFRVRDAAEATLRSIPSAIEDLFQVLMDSEDSEVCQRVTSILREYPQEVRRGYLDTAIKRFIALFDRSDGRYQFFFDFAQAIDPEPLRQKIYQKARQLKGSSAKDKWTKIAGYLQLLWDHHLITTEGRYLFAIALLRQSPKDLSPPARRSNLGLRVLRALIYDDGKKLLESLTKDRDVGPEEIFYVGFHFMEEGDELRPFARELLEHLIRKFPKSSLSSPARQKLDLHAIVIQQRDASAGTKGSRAGAAAAKAAAAATAAAQAAGKLPAPVPGKAAAQVKPAVQVKSAVPVKPAALAKAKAAEPPARTAAKKAAGAASKASRPKKSAKPLKKAAKPVARAKR